MFSPADVAEIIQIVRAKVLTVPGTMPAQNLSNGVVGSGKIVLESALAENSEPVSRTSATGSTTITGTVLADIVADPGMQLVALNILGTTDTSSGTNLTITVTYLDGTTTAVTMSAQVTGNQGGVAQSGGAGSVTQFSAKEIVEVKVVATGAGTGPRAASVSALEIPQ